MLKKKPFVYQKCSKISFTLFCTEQKCLPGEHSFQKTSNRIPNNRRKYSRG